MNCADCLSRPGVVEVGDDEATEGTVWFCRTCYATLRLSGHVIRDPDAEPEAIPADAGRVLSFPVAPDGSRLRGYYPGVECEHGWDACPKCDAIEAAPSPRERADLNSSTDLPHPQ